MPTLEWLRNEFNYGYDSGNVLSRFPNLRRRSEEQRIGGSYRQVFYQAILPYLHPSAKVLELGPGKGSWSRAILQYIPDGELHTIDFQDVRPWLQPQMYGDRLICHQVKDNSYYSSFADDFFDFFWSFGVLCHNKLDDINEILLRTLPKMKSGGVAVHQYSDWEKLERYGWKKGGVPLEFKHQPDDEIWWCRNTQKEMTSVAQNAGWTIICPDLNLLKRDSIIVLQCP